MADLLIAAWLLSAYPIGRAARLCVVDVRPVMKPIAWAALFALTWFAAFLLVGSLMPQGHWAMGPVGACLFLPLYARWRRLRKEGLVPPWLGLPGAIKSTRAALVAREQRESTKTPVPITAQPPTTNGHAGEYRFKYWGRDDKLTKRVVYIDSYSVYRESHYLNGYEEGKGDRSFMTDAIEMGELKDTATGESIDVETLLLMLPETPPNFGQDF